MYIPIEVRPSTIFGRGLFPLQNVRRGTLICSFTTDSKVITEDEYLDGIKANHPLIVRTGTRYVGKYFTYTKQPDEDLNFFNHSFTPNLLVHCGVVIAMRHISPGEELTIDYRYVIDDSAIGVYSDAATGTPIRGFSARQTLKDTCHQLTEILKDVDESWQG